MEIQKLEQQERQDLLIKLYESAGTLEGLAKQEVFNSMVNMNPPAKWVKKHPFIRDHHYLPIDKVEFLLRKLFKSYTITITNQGTAFNGVFVTVRVTYTNPVTGELEFQDGIGAAQLQTKKGTSPAAMENINSGAIQMAFPVAKTLAVKDACDHIGKIFGSDLNRKDALTHVPDNEIISKNQGIKDLMENVA